MNITDEPMPGVAQPRSGSYFMILCRKDSTITLHEAWPIYKLEHACAKARALAAEEEFDEVIVVEAEIAYRVWKNMGQVPLGNLAGDPRPSSAAMPDRSEASQTQEAP